MEKRAPFKGMKWQTDACKYWRECDQYGWTCRPI